jgi:DNA helicase MCM9
MDASLSSISDLAPWNFEQLQRYILYVKHAFEPKMTPECELILTTYYQMQRQIDIRNASRITLRLLESLVRLTQAHAKLMFRDEMTADDAVIVVLLVEISLNGSGMNMGSNYDMRRPISVLKSDFPKDPKKDHHSKKCFVLRKLGLEHLIKDI